MKDFIKNHPLVTILLFLLIGPASLNYSGFCIAQGRYLSDEEKILTELTAINNLDLIPIEIKGYGTKYYKQIKYTNVKEFLEKNPECCQVGLHLKGDYFPPSFIDRIRGRYSYKTRVTFRANYIDSNNKNQSKIVTFDGISGSCGKPYNF